MSKIKLFKKKFSEIKLTQAAELAHIRIFFFESSLT